MAIGPLQTDVQGSTIGLPRIGTADLPYVSRGSVFARSRWVPEMSRRNLLILLLAVVVSYACYLRGEQNPFARYASEGLTTIKQSSLDAVPSRELFDGAMREWWACFTNMAIRTHSS